MTDFLEPINFHKHKIERWEEMLRHQSWITKAIEYWTADYAQTGSTFSNDMSIQFYELLEQLSRSQDYIERPDVVVFRPKFPIYPDSDRM